MQDSLRQSINNRNIFLNKYFNLILSFLVLIFFIVIYITVLGPKFQTAQAAIKENLVSQQLLLNQQQKKLDTLKVIADIYSKVSVNDLAKFNSVLPDEYKQEQLFGEFEEIAEKNGWLLRSVSLDYLDEAIPGQAIQTISEEDHFYGSVHPNVGRVEINLNFAGLDYQAMKRLLAVLESNLRLFDVSQVSFSGGSEVTLTLTTYYYKNNN